MEALLVLVDRREVVRTARDLEQRAGVAPERLVLLLPLPQEVGERLRPTDQHSEELRLAV